MPEVTPLISARRIKELVKPFAFGAEHTDDLEQLAAQIIREAGEAAAKILDERKTSGGAGHVLMECAAAIRARLPTSR